MNIYAASSLALRLVEVAKEVKMSLKSLIHLVSSDLPVVKTYLKYSFAERFWAIAAVFLF